MAAIGAAEVPPVSESTVSRGIARARARIGRDGNHPVHAMPARRLRVFGSTA